MRQSSMHRRGFLQRSGAIATGIALTPDGFTASPAPRIVDTHTHFYDPTRKQGVPWPPANSPLHRPVYPKDWQAVARPHGVTHTVVVEASVWVEDNHWILDLAAEEKTIVGFVGNLEPMDAAFSANLKRFSANPIFRGLRRSNQALLENIAKPEFIRAMTQLADLGLELDVNGLRREGFATVAKLAGALPSLRIVVDHVGNAGDPNKLTAEWRAGMRALGGRGNVFCKVSGLIEQSEESTRRYGSAPRDTEYYRPILDHCWECFGEDRLIYGSNWPVSDKGGSYSDQFKIVDEYFSARGAAAREKYFTRNSMAAYRWAAR